MSVRTISSEHSFCFRRASSSSCFVKPGPSDQTIAISKRPLWENAPMPSGTYLNSHLRGLNGCTLLSRIMQSGLDSMAPVLFRTGPRYERWRTSSANADENKWRSEISSIALNFIATYFFAQRPELRHAGPKTVNREAELRARSRVACSD